MVVIEGVLVSIGCVVVMCYVVGIGVFDDGDGRVFGGVEFGY